MRKHWVAMLSMVGLAGSGVRVQSQVLKGSTNPDKTDNTTIDQQKVKTSQGVVSPRDPANKGKLKVNQQTLRQQNQTGKGNGALTPPPPGQAGGENATTDAATTQPGNQLTKGSAQVTKGSAQVTKGNAQVTKGNAQVTKGNAQVTKGNAQVTKGNAQVTKGNAQVTKGNAAVTKGGANNQITK